VNAPSAWHICGTSHACLGSPRAFSRTPVLLIIPEPECPNRWERFYGETASSPAGGGHNLGERVAGTIKLAADDVQTLVIPGCAHWVAEETPEDTLTALIAFLAPYRDGTAGAQPQDA